MEFKRFLQAEWDRIAGYACLAAGAVALVFGFVGVRSSADVVDEISYLVTGGIGAMFLLGVGATLLLSADLHDDFRKLHRVEQKLDLIHRALLAEHPELIDPPPGPGESRGCGQAPVAVGANVGANAGGNGGAKRPTHLADAPGALAVRRARRLSVAGVAVAAGLFAAGSLRTATEAGTDHMAGGIGVALAGALLAAGVAGLMVGQLKGLLERRKLAVLGPWELPESEMARPEMTSSGPVDRVFVVEGLSLYHRPGCRALEGRVAAELRPGNPRAGLQRCGLCEPG